VSPRIIHLRRPPVLQPVAEPFVPPGLPLDEVDRRWRELCRANPAYFDGRCLHVLGVHRNGHGGASLHVAPCSYRFWAVQNALRDEGIDLGVRPLGVKGMTRRGEHVLMGRRSPRVAGYPGLWEFAPGGAVEPGVDPAATLAGELIEETGLRAAAPPTPIAIIHDDALRCWELIYRIAVDERMEPMATDEYPEVGWFRPAEAPAPLSPIAECMIELLSPSRGNQLRGGEQSD